MIWPVPGVLGRGVVMNGRKQSDRELLPGCSFGSDDVNIRCMWLPDSKETISNAFNRASNGILPRIVLTWAR